MEGDFYYKDQKKKDELLESTKKLDMWLIYERIGFLIVSQGEDWLASRGF